MPWTRPIGPCFDALVSATHRAPIWLTAFNVATGHPVGVLDPSSGFAGGEEAIDAIAVSSELQELVRSRSASMTLSTNGVHDSLAPPLVNAARAMIRTGAASPEAVAVAALRAGWWPEKVPALIEKLGG